MHLSTLIKLGALVFVLLALNVLVYFGVCGYYDARAQAKERAGDHAGALTAPEKKTGGSFRSRPRDDFRVTSSGLEGTFLCTNRFHRWV